VVLGVHALTELQKAAVAELGELKALSLEPLQKFLMNRKKQQERAITSMLKVPMASKDTSA
jgi:hypothetical protein